MLPILLSALCCFPLIYISSHKQVVPTLSEILSYEKDQIHFKCTSLCFCSVFFRQMREHEKQRYIQRQNQCTCVTRIERSSYNWSQGIREFFLSGLRAWHVELISYRWADKMIVFTVHCHSHRALTYSQCLFLWYLGVKQQQFMVRWQLDSAEGSVKRQSM